MEDILKCDYNAYVCRLRIPFNNISNPKNYITKLINYDKLLDATNSLTNIDDFLNACFYLKNYSLFDLVHIARNFYFVKIY